MHRKAPGSIHLDIFIPDIPFEIAKSTFLNKLHTNKKLLLEVVHTDCYYGH